MIKLDRFPNGKTQILTMSYDDGQIHDRRLVEVFNKYGIKGTFHLNSGRLGLNNNVTKDEIKKLYQNHEISAHTVNHPNLTCIRESKVLREILDDKEALEALCGYPVRGMSLPFGRRNTQVDNLIKSCGLKYSRTTVSTNNFLIPEDFIQWNPTCHHRDCLERADFFTSQYKYPWRHVLFYVWGHSFEFSDNNDWHIIEEFCKQMSGHENVWYAANIEIYDYIQAQNNLIISENEKIIINPSFCSVWISIDNEAVEIKGGQKLTL